MYNSCVFFAFLAIRARYYIFTFYTSIKPKKETSLVVFFFIHVMFLCCDKWINGFHKKLDVNLLLFLIQTKTRQEFELHRSIFTYKTEKAITTPRLKRALRKCQ
jgi:hypothetical protein